MITKRTGEKGFTLIEVLAALALLGWGMTVLIRSQTQSLNNVRMVANYERAVFITENQLHWTFLDLNAVEDWEEYRDQSDFDGDYHWQVRIEPAEMEREGQVEMVMLKIIATTTWMEGSREMSYSLETWYFWGENR